MPLTNYLFQQCLRVHNQITGNAARKLTLLIIEEKIKELQQQPYDFSGRISELEKMKEEIECYQQFNRTFVHYSENAGVY